MIYIKDEVLKDRNISSTAKLIYGIIASSDNAICNKTIEQMSDDLNVSIMAIRNNLEKLIIDEYISKHQDYSVKVKKYLYKVLK